MKNLYILIISLLAFSSCLPKQQVASGPRTGVDRPRTSSVAPNRGTSGTSARGWEYIARYRDICIEEMKTHGIPASIKMAQALLESGYGASRLAVESNNHFGIKCASGWEGGRTYQDDDEADECFRAYKNPEESFKDHSAFLLRKRYEALFHIDKRNYKAWARGLKDAGYATNPRYADLLVDLIERYELYKFDDEGYRATPSDKYLTASSSPADTPPNRVIVSSSAPTKSAVPDPPPSGKGMQVHEVKNGETAEQIAARYSLSLSQLLSLNQLKSAELLPGQLLVVAR